MRRTVCLATLIWAATLTAGQAACRLALVLALDVSASVDPDEYRLQAAGTAAALLSDPVQTLVLSGDPVALAVFVWSGVSDQTLVADWRIIDTRATLEALAARIAGFERPRGLGGRTATGAAMQFGQALLARAPACDRQVIDLATDGTFNAGPPPEVVRHTKPFAEITINALAVAGGAVPDWREVKQPDAALQLYLIFRVIHGPGAFVEMARNYGDFERAMGRKLERELQGMVLGALPQ